MGFSVVVASAIMFSAFIVFSMIIYDTLDTSYQDLQDAQDERDDLSLKHMNTQFQIDSITRDQDLIVLKATNSGTIPITIHDRGIYLIDVLINGSLVTDKIVSFLINDMESSFWGPGETLYVHMLGHSLGTSSTVILVTTYGEMAEFTYYDPPSARFSISGEQPPYDLDEDTIYVFDGSQTTNTHQYSGSLSELDWYWDFDDGSTGMGMVLKHTFSEPGSYTPVLTITIPDGSMDRYSSPVTVRDTTLPNALIIAQPVVVEGNQISLSSSVSDNVGVTNWSWNLGDGSLEYTEHTTHTYLLPGSYTVLLQVRDIAGNEFISSMVIQVLDNTPPTTMAGDDQTTRVNRTVFFNGTASFDPEDGMILHYLWDFGDGYQDSGPYANHAYSSSGNYTVTLETIDIAGNRSTDTLTVRVQSEGTIRGVNHG